MGKRQMRFLVVAIDYFTKWVEAEPLAKITKKNIRNFTWRSIICQFGIPRVIISYNSKKFNNARYQELYVELSIKNHFSSPAYPQATAKWRSQIERSWA